MAELRTGRKKIVATIEIPKRGRGNLTAEGTPLVVLYRDFEISQKDKGNAEQTIQYYDRGFAKFCVFLANRYYYTGLMKTFNIDKETAKKATQLMRDKLGIDEDENENIKAYADGMMMPVAILMAEGLESNYRDYLRNECKVSEVTVASYFRAYRAIAYFAMDEEWIPRRKIVVGEAETPIKNCYTEKELQKLLRRPHDSDFNEFRNWVIVNYLLSTGNRVSSICELNVGDVDLDEGYITVNRQKNKKPTHLPLNPKIIRILKDYIERYRTEVDGVSIGLNEPLFPNMFNERMSENGMKKAIATYNRSRGVEKTSIHLFRHTFAKQWILDGGDAFTLQRMLGQSSLKMVQRYLNLYSTDIKEQAIKHSAIMKTKTKSKKIR